ncbi:hypothetical protein JW859_14655 [bacterium]|nr:hypothetical protein [bacterium]
MFRISAFTALAALLVLAGSAVLVTGCNDSGESDMMQQMMAGGGNRTNRPDRSAADKTNAEAQPADAAEGTEDAAETPEEEGPKPSENVVIEKIEIDRPYPEFEGEGRYDIKVYVMLKEHEEAQVYRIAAIDADGNEVGSQERQLKLPLRKPRSFNFNEFYCTKLPVTLAFFYTDKEATVAEDSGEAGGNTSRGTGSTGKEGGGIERGMGGRSGGSSSGDEEDEDM